MTKPFAQQERQPGRVIFFPHAGRRGGCGPNAARTEGQDQLNEATTVSSFTPDSVLAEIDGAGEVRVCVRSLALHRDTAIRILTVVALSGLVLWLNLTVLEFVKEAFAADLAMLESNPPTLQAANRLVTSDVLIALIAAMVLQVGASMAAIKSLSRSKRRAE